MVLNLLQRYELSKAKELVERSFGRYLASLDLVEEEEHLGELRMQLALLQGTWALTSPLKRLRRAATVTKGANVGLASLKPADLKIAGSAACGSYIQGYTTGVLGGALLFLGPHFGLTPAQIGAVATATTLGSVLGTFSASALADAAGRRPTMAFSSALFVAASVLMVWTPSLDVLVLARFLAGVGIGNCGAVVPVYVAECAEAASRGALATLPQLMISSGAMSGLVVTFAVALCRTGLGWSAATASRVSLGFTLLPSQSTSGPAGLVVQ